MLFAIVLAFSISAVSAADNISTTKVATTSSQSGATVVSPKVTFTSAQINAAASKIKTFVETNNRLPTM